jgi:hypothetical protein
MPMVLVLVVLLRVSPESAWVMFALVEVLLVLLVILMG